MKIEIPEDMAIDVSAMLARRGQNEDVSTYVQRMLAKKLLFETVGDIWKNNKNTDMDQLEEDIREALD